MEALHRKECLRNCLLREESYFLKRLERAIEAASDGTLDLRGIPLSELPSAILTFEGLTEVVLDAFAEKTLPKNDVAACRAGYNASLHEYLSERQKDCLQKIAGALSEADRDRITHVIVAACHEQFQAVVRIRMECLWQGWTTTLKLKGDVENQVSFMPLAKLPTLRALDLQSNQIVRLPEVVCSLVHLESLNLYNNQLTELPSSVAQLQALKTLRLGLNQIVRLPEVV